TLPPPTALLPSLPPPGLRYAERRGAGRITVVLLGVLALVLGGYLVREVLLTAAPTGVPGGTAMTTAPVAPVTPSAVPGPVETPPSAKQQPIQPEPTKMQPDPEPTNPGDAAPEVLIIPTDYLGYRGSDAVVTAKQHGLIPRVIDDNGDQIDPDLRSQCRVTGVDPLSGYVPLRSTLELTCREGQ
ncbi:MAG: hypothetical protein ACRDRB_12330, partial [Pseudonocardiaceae bacterium]